MKTFCHKMLRLSHIFHPLFFIFLLHATFSDACRATWYNLGLTACGTWHNNNEMVAAVGRSYWSTPNPNLDPMCLKSARVTDPASGKSVTVQIKDICGSCTANDIDLSPAAFSALRPLDVGLFAVNWEYLSSAHQCIGTVIADVLNVRSTPSSSGNIVDRLSNSRIVNLQSRHEGENVNGNTGWFYVGNGYAAAYYLNLSPPPRPTWCY